MPLPEKIRTLIDNAWVDGCPCMLATTGSDGPNISPKGSLLVSTTSTSPIGSVPRRRRSRISVRTSASS